MFFEIEDKIYLERYNKAYLFLKSGLTGNKEKDISLLKETITTLSTYNGNDWIGRGSLSEIKNKAIISAAESIISELEFE